MKIVHMQNHIRKVYREMQINEMLQDEEYQIFVKPEYNSAYWTFHEGVHKIIIGQNIFEMMDKNITDKTKIQLLYAFLNHEFSHSLWSDKELAPILEVVEKSGFLFEVFNLFEDARVEEKMRQHIKKRFSWSYFSTLLLPLTPVSIFFYILQSEHTRQSFHYLEKELTNDEYILVKRVFSYYKRVLACLCSQDILKVMTDWYMEFPDTDKDMEPFIHLKETQEIKMLFTQESTYILYPELFEELLEGLENILIDDKNVRPSLLNPALIETRRTISGGNGNLLSYEVPDYKINKHDEALMYKRIAKLFQKKHRYSNSDYPSKRLNTKKLASGSSKIFRRKEQLRGHKAKITLIVDMSGSMESIVDNMQLVLRVMNTLSKDNIIECQLILSGLNGGESEYQTFRLPQNTAVINQMYPRFWGEALDNTMRCNLKQMKESDYVWILTDGCITTDGIDKKYYHKYGIYTHAFYIGSLIHQQSMEEYFDSVLCCADAVGLMDNVLKMI